VAEVYLDFDRSTVQEQGSLDLQPVNVEVPSSSSAIERLQVSKACPDEAHVTFNPALP
jgi:hypothetical protein